MLNKLAAGVTANGTQSDFNTTRTTGKEGLFQVEITGAGTCTVYIEGRASTDAPWVTIDSFTASGAKWVALFPVMHTRVASVSGGVTVNAWLVD